MEGSWSLHAVERNMHALYLVDFNDWLEDKVEAHNSMRQSRKPEANCLPSETAVNFFKT